MDTSLLHSTELLKHYRQLSQKPLVVVDLETTGGYPTKHRVIEIAGLHASLADGIQLCRSHLINPQVSIPAKITQFTGISQEMVDSAPPSAVVFSDYAPLLNSGLFTAHNVDFDYRFIEAEMGRINIPFHRPAEERLCTVRLSRLMLPDLPSRSLPDLVNHFQFEVGPSHRAEADAQACWLLAKRLLTQIQNEPDEVLLDMFGREWIPLTLAARLLSCSRNQARTRLEQANAPFRWSQRRQNPRPMYRRSDVERIMTISGESLPEKTI